MLLLFLVNVQVKKLLSNLAPMNTMIATIFLTKKTILLNQKDNII